MYSVTTVLSAMGQLFYSMSLAMGVMITFGSYMKKEISIEKSVRRIEMFDTGIAFLSGLMVIPAVFAFSGGDEADLDQGAGLMFETLPMVFASMRGGDAIGVVFFLMVLLAALTSSISLMETVVAVIQDIASIGRKPACRLALSFSMSAGLFFALGYSAFQNVRIMGLTVLDFFDFVSNNVLMPIVAFVTCIFVGYVITPAAVTEEVELCGRFKAKKLFCVMIRYIAPVFILLIFVSSVLDVFGVIKI